MLSCNFSSFPLNSLYPKTSANNPATPFLKPSICLLNHRPFSHKNYVPGFLRKGRLQIFGTSIKTQSSKDPLSNEEELKIGGTDNGGCDEEEEERDWTTSFLLFGMWAGLMYYIFNLAPNLTPSTDKYFLEKLLNLKGEDGFHMNEVMVALWYIMGLWPIVYSMLLLPTGRSSRSKIPVWPFLILSCFGGVYALLPYFAIWRPPPPPIEETELGRWPLNVLESKLTAGIVAAAGLGIIIYAGFANGDVWKEFYQYFRGSKFIHITSIDFTLLSAFAPFWVYNDMTVRKWDGKGFWLLPLSLIPFVGPVLYLLLRPSLSATPAVLSSTKPEEE